MSRAGSIPLQAIVTSSVEWQCPVCTAWHKLTGQRQALVMVSAEVRCECSTLFTLAWGLGSADLAILRLPTPQSSLSYEPAP